MIKEDPRGRFIKLGLSKLYRFYSGKFCSTELWYEETYQALLKYQQDTPVKVMIIHLPDLRQLPSPFFSKMQPSLFCDYPMWEKAHGSCRRWWMFREKFYWENESYTEQEVKALITEKLRKKERKVKKTTALIDQEELTSTLRRQSIPDEVKIFVWRRDEGRCVKCGSQKNLEFDHIIPLFKGGSNTARNIQLLCETCNRSKGDSLV